MNRALASLAALVACGCGSSVLAQSWPPTQFQSSIFRSGEAHAAIEIGGVWRGACTPIGAITFLYSPGRLHMNIDHGWASGAGCGNADTPWSRAVDTPPLGNGVIELHVTMSFADGTRLGPVFMGPLVTNGGCVADIDDGSGTCTPDGDMSTDDLLFFLYLYSEGEPDADVDDGSATHAPDGAVTIDDLLFYLQRYEAGC